MSYIRSNTVICENPVVYSVTIALTLQCGLESMKSACAGTSFRVSAPEFLIMMQGPIVCISVMFPEDVGEAGLETTL